MRYFLIPYSFRWMSPIHQMLIGSAFSSVSVTPMLSENTLTGSDSEPPMVSQLNVSFGLLLPCRPASRLHCMCSCNTFRMRSDPNCPTLVRRRFFSTNIRRNRIPSSSRGAKHSAHRMLLSLRVSTLRRLFMIVSPRLRPLSWLRTALSWVTLHVKTGAYFHNILG